MEAVHRGHVRRDESKRRELIGAWRKSGKTVKAFCAAPAGSR